MATADLVLFCKSYRQDLRRAVQLCRSVHEFNRDSIPFYLSVPAEDLDAFAESLNARVRDEFLNSNDFYTLMEAEILAKDYWMQYNNERPHSSLGYLAPAEFARTWPMEHEQEPVGLS